MTERQRPFEFVGWGGKRAGAGRPRKPDAKLRHAPRSPLANRFPAHVTLRAVRGGPNLRRRATFAAIEAALHAVRESRDDFRVVHFTVESNHLHAIVEADGASALSRGMQALAIRIARGVNRAARRDGKLWADRFHARILRSPREVRAALCYVLQNTRRHETCERPAGAPPTSKAQTWLLREGWRKAGLIRVDEVPRAASR